jgi:hypothetical protein
VDWTVIGDLIPAYYTTISKTEFTLVTGTKSKIYVGPIDAIPTGSKSLPVRVYSDYSPDEDLEVTITLATNPALSEITVSATSLFFTPGVTEQYFTIFCATGLDTINIKASSLTLGIAGTNVKAFELDNAVVNFSLIDYFTTTPYIESIASSITKRTVSTIAITTNIDATVYYAVSLKGTRAPSVEELTSWATGVEVLPENFSNSGLKYNYSTSSKFSSVGLTGLVG